VDLSEVLKMNQWRLLLVSAACLSTLVIWGCELEECEEGDETCCEEGDDECEENQADGGTVSDSGGGTTTDTGRDTSDSSGGGRDTDLGCGADNACNSTCASDPDCEPASCDCDDTDEVCDNASSGGTGNCACDDDCNGTSACRDDDYCDDSCPADADPNCDCACDYNADVCESVRRGSTDECECDFDCEVSPGTCKFDDHCDTFCPAGVDPDCEEDPVDCSCDYNEGICEVASRGSENACACDADCVGADPCKSDTHCDTWCPAGFDPDCR
jgi:hypothetical protein